MIARRPAIRNLALLGLLMCVAPLCARGSVSAQATPDAIRSAARGVSIGGCETVRASGRVILQPVVPTGAPQPGLTVVDPATGDEIGRIDVPPVTSVFQTMLPDRVLAIAGGDLFLIDTANLTATWIELDEPAGNLSPNPIQFRGTAGTRFVLLGSPSFDLTVLVDVQEGRATNLTALIVPLMPDAKVFLPFAAVTPDDAHVLMWDGQHVYVVDTANPEGARQVDTGAFAFAPDFSQDGHEIVYSRSDGPGSGSELILEAIDGSASKLIATSEHALVTLWVPRSRTLLVDERTEAGAATGSVSLLDVDTGQETPLLEYAGSLSTVQFDPGGMRALLGAEQRGASAWHIADLATGDVEELPQIEGSRVLPGLYADARWALAVPPADSDDPIAGPAFRGIDLETGAVGRLLEQPDGVNFDRAPLLSPAGRLSLVAGESSRETALWLLDAADLMAHRVADGSSVSAVFAPDACHIAISVEAAVDGIPSTAV